MRMWFIGWKSLLVIALTESFTGMVVALQGFPTLRRFRAEALLGLMVALSLIRELGPVLTALMVTGRAGSALSPWVYVGGAAATLAIPAYREVNGASRRSGEYESFKRTTLGPYVAMRSVYYEHRAEEVQKSNASNPREHATTRLAQRSARGKTLP